MKKKTGAASYKAAHKTMKTTDLKVIAALIQEEINKPEPRMDLVSRLVGRYNRIDGARRMRDVLGLLSKRGKKNVDAVLGNNR